MRNYWVKMISSGIIFITLFPLKFGDSLHTPHNSEWPFFKRWAHKSEHGNEMAILSPGTICSSNKEYKDTQASFGDDFLFSRIYRYQHPTNACLFYRPELVCGMYEECIEHKIIDVLLLSLLFEPKYNNTNTRHWFKITINRKYWHETNKACAFRLPIR